MLAFGSASQALPIGGAVSAGGAGISAVAGAMTVVQSTQNVAINWQSFSIGQGESVRFLQPNSSSVALNRVLGPDPSSILGSLSANGKVFLVNPNGILFGRGAQVNVGALVASTRGITDSEFMAGNYRFAGEGNGAIVNQGSINADGGYVALLGASISNEGVISARLGTVALAAGNAVTLDVAGDGLLSVTVNQGALDALASNGGLIRADGGQVLLTALSAGNLMRSAVNNTGVIQAQTVENRNGTIRLMGDMREGTMNVAGTLDASAPNGGNGGFIETSAAHVHVANDVRITTAAPAGLTGTWLIDPVDFVIAPLGGNISGATLSAQLVNNSVVIATVAGPGPGNGDIVVNDVIDWTTAVPLVPTTLTLNALRDVNVNQAISATDGNLVICCGRDVNIGIAAAITTVRGSILLSAGRNANLGGAITAGNGNLTACAGLNVNVDAAITVTNGTLDPVRSLGLDRGLVLSAGNGGTGPGIGAGTVTFNPIFPATVTAAPTTIIYNPVSYIAPTDYSINIIGLAPTQRMLVFPDGASKAFDGTTTATFTGLKSTAVSGVPVGVALAGAGTANFDTPDVGLAKTVSFTGFSLVGVNAGDFALPITCCGPAVGRTTANISAALIPVLPGGVAPPGGGVPGGGVSGGGVPGGVVAGVAIVALAGLSTELSGLGLSVLDGGINVPASQLVEAAPPTVAPANAVEAPPIAAPVVIPPPVPQRFQDLPPLPRKRDRSYAPPLPLSNSISMAGSLSPLPWAPSRR